MPSCQIDPFNRAECRGLRLIMDLEELLRSRKKDLVQKWFHAVVETYSADAFRFFTHHKDPFTNPVGGTFRKGLSELYDHLVNPEEEPSRIGACLDPMIRIRAVQNFPPSKAIGFLFQLKRILRRELADRLQNPGLEDSLVAIEARIDAFGLMAFDVFMQCREKIYQLKADEIRVRTFKAFKRAGLVYESPQTKPDPDDYH